MLDTDMLDTPRTNHAVRGLFAARDQRATVAGPEAAAADAGDHGDWVKLGADTPPR